jgi:large subunit ribosomal protein L9
MRVILTETIESLGIIGTEVDVKPGYARNFLLPKEKAVVATRENRKRMQQQQKKFELQIAKEKAHAREMAERLEEVKVTIPAKVSDEDRLYGSVNTRDIVRALAQKDVEVEKRMVLLTEPIKRTGEYKVPIRIYADVEPEITVEVVPL